MSKRVIEVVACAWCKHTSNGMTEKAADEGHRDHMDAMHPDFKAVRQ